MLWSIQNTVNFFQRQVVVNVNILIMKISEALAGGIAIVWCFPKIIMSNIFLSKTIFVKAVFLMQLVIINVIFILE